MKLRNRIAMPFSAIVLGSLAAFPATALAEQPNRQPSSVNESAPAQTGNATVPTQQRAGQPLAGGAPAYPPRGASGVNESSPATAGSASTPTAGKGQVPAAVGRTEAMNRLPQTPSSVSESAPARTGSASVPTARYTRMWDQADANNDGVVGRFEFDGWMGRQHGAAR